MIIKENQFINKENDEVSLKELILKIKDWCKFILSKWIIIFSFGLIGGSIGLAYAYVKKPVYIATTTFVMENGESNSGGLAQYAGIASMVGLDLRSGGGGIFEGDNIIELYKSRTMIEKTLFSKFENNNKFETLMDRYIEINDLREGWKENKPLLDLKFGDSAVANSSDAKLQRLRDSVILKTVEDIRNNYLKISKLDKKLNIIKVDINAKDELFAKDFNENIVKNVNDFYVQTKTRKSLDNVAILQRKTDSVRAVMNGAIFSAATVIDATPNLNPTRQILRVAPMQRAQFSAETNKSIFGSLVQNLEMAKMTLLKETPLIQVIDQPIYPLEIKKVGKTTSFIVFAVIAGFFVVIILCISRIIKTA